MLKNYPPGLHIRYPDLILDGFFVLMITVSLLTVAWWQRAFAEQTRICGDAARCGWLYCGLAGRLAQLAKPAPAVIWFLLAAPALLVAVAFWTTHAYLPMILGDAVSVLGLWWGVRIGTLSENHAGRVAWEEFAAIGLAFAAYLFVLVPAAAASRFLANTRSSQSRIGQKPLLAANSDQPQTPPETEKPDG